MPSWVLARRREQDCTSEECERLLHICIHCVSSEHDVARGAFDTGCHSTSTRASLHMAVSLRLCIFDFGLGGAGLQLGKPLCCDLSYAQLLCHHQGNNGREVRLLALGLGSPKCQMKVRLAIIPAPGRSAAKLFGEHG